MKIEQIISDAAVKAVKALYGIEAAPGTTVPQKTKKEFEGTLTLVVFPFLKASHKAPEATAQEIGEYLLANEPAVASFNVIKGFLNLVIAPSFWSQMLHHIDEEADFGTHKAAADAPLVMVEYSSPNTNKPLHLGHVRNNLLGYSLSEILKANGNRVVKTNIVNDRGIHICKSMLAWQKWGDGVTPEKAGKKGDHLIGDFYVLFDKHYKQELKELEAKGMTPEEAEAASPLMQEARAMLRKWEAGDPEVRSVWEMMNNWVYAGFDETYRRLGVDFDKIYYESQTYLEGKEKVLEGLEKGIMYRKEDGSVWADLTAEGLDHKLLLRSDGTSVYMTQDIGTAKLRFKDFPIDKMIYVVGNEQNYHFQVQMGQRSRAFLLRYGGVARRKNEIARRYGSGCRRLDGRDDRHRSRDIGRIGQTRRLYRRGSGRNFSYRGFRRIEILYFESRSPQEHDFQSQRVYRLQREHGAFHSVHPRPHLLGHAQGCRSRYRLSPSGHR